MARLLTYPLAAIQAHADLRNKCHTIALPGNYVVMDGPDYIVQVIICG